MLSFVCAACNEPRPRAESGLQELYDASLSIRSAIPHPRVMGIIRESGGKMHMREKAWEKAHTDFFEAFKSFDDAGSPRRCARRFTCTGISAECIQAWLEWL